jgi:hypothetical protein
LAALAIGNSVKNQYEFQLWILDKEPVAILDAAPEASEDKSNLARSKSSPHQYYPSLLSSLLRLLETGSDQSRRSALYAVSASARGNLDVQAALRDNLAAAMDPAASVDVSALLLQRLEDGSAELRRKIFAFISDMLEEQYYIQEQIRNPENFLIDGDASGQELELMKQLHALRPLGKSFCTSQWALTGWQSLDATVLELASETSAIQDCLAAAGEVEPKCSTQEAVAALDEDLAAAAEEEHTRDDVSCSPSVLLSTTKRHEATILRALVENSLSALRHMYLACPPLAQDEAEVARHSRSLRDARTWAQRVGDFSGEVDQHAATMQVGLGLGL